MQDPPRYHTLSSSAVSAVEPTGSKGGVQLPEPELRLVLQSKLRAHTTISKSRTSRCKAYNATLNLLLPEEQSMRSGVAGRIANLEQRSTKRKEGK
eukprot:6471022-Amphidinium_carterae.2